MFRFFATLLVTGAGVLGASAWWSGRDVPSVPRSLTEQSALADSGTGPAAAANAPVKEEPTFIAKPVAAAKPTIPARTVPSIPAPRLASPIEFSRIVAPALPEPIPAPVLSPTTPAEVEETRIPEPAVFRDETLELAHEGGFGAEHEEFANETYGEENIIFVEADDITDISPGDDDAPFITADGEHELAMSSHDASAARIRRLLDVYESLGSRR